MIDKCKHRVPSLSRMNVFAISLLVMTFMLLTFITLAPKAYAACSNPNAAVGTMIYNTDENVPQYCDDTNWIRMAPESPAYNMTAVEFDGSNDYLDLDSALTGATTTKQMTASFWVKYDDVASTGLIFDGAANDDIRIYYSTSSDDLEFLIRSASTSGVIGQIRCDLPGTPSTGVWYNYIASFDMTDPNKQHCYRNDVDTLQSVAANTDDFMGSDHGDWRFGANNDGPVTQKFNGSIGDFWLDFGTYMDLDVESNRRKFIDDSGNPVNLGADGSLPTGSQPDIFLSGDADSWHNNKGAGGGFTEFGALTSSDTLTGSGGSAGSSGDFTSNLIGHWSLDQTEGTVAYDSAGSYDGTMSGGLDASAHSVDGVRDTALDFDGSNYYIRMASEDGDFSIDTHTVAAWVYRATDQDDSEMIIDNRDALDDGWFIDVNGGGPDDSFRCHYNDYVYRTAVRAKLDTWMHVACVSDGSDMYAYVDGEYIGSVALTGSISETTDAAIGARNWGPDTFHWEGYIDDVRVYDRDLSADDIMSLYLNSNSFCNNPPGVAGQIQYDIDTKMPKYCDGGNWVAMDDKYVPNAVTLEGGVDYLGGNSMGVADSKSVSFSFWAKRNNDSGTDVVFDCDSGGAGESCGRIRFQAGRLIIEFGRDSDNTVIYSWDDPPVTAVDTTQWTHYLFSVDLATSGSTTLFVNDVEQVVVPDIFIDDFIGFDANYTISINSAIGIDGALADFWLETGLYTDFTIEANRRKFIDANGKPVDLGTDGSFPTGASPDIFLSGDTDTWHTNKGTGGGFTENGELTDAPTSPPGTSLLNDPSLVAYWPLNEPSGSAAVDFAGNYNGTLSSNVFFASTSGKIGGAADFPGENAQNIDTADGLDFSGNAPYTLSGWAYVRSFPETFADIVSKFDDGGGTYAWWLSAHNTSGFRCGRHTGGGGYVIKSQGSALTTDQWYHVLCTYDGSDLRLYIDGAAVGSPVAATDPINDNDARVSIGAHSTNGGTPNASEFDGLIDDVRIYDRALSAAEIDEIFTAGDNNLAAQDCQNPNGAEGAMIFNLDESAVQYCDGVNWNILGKRIAAVVLDACTGTASPPSIGETCTDGSIYAGLSPDGNVPMYTTAADAGLFPWNNGNTTGYNNPASYSDTAGEANTVTIVSLDADTGVGGIQPNQAAQYCYDLVVNSHSDWYLPAPDEIDVLYQNRNSGDLTGTFNETGTYPSGYYWSSRTSFSSNAFGVRMNDGTSSSNGKSLNSLVRCVRRN